MMEQIKTYKTTKKEVKRVLEHIREGKDFNLKTKKGFIYMSGGILCKLENDKLFVCQDKRWKEVFN